MVALEGPYVENNSAAGRKGKFGKWEMRRFGVTCRLCVTLAQTFYTDGSQMG